MTGMSSFRLDDLGVRFSCTASWLPVLWVLCLQCSGPVPSEDMLERLPSQTGDILRRIGFLGLYIVMTNLNSVDADRALRTVGGGEMESCGYILAQYPYIICVIFWHVNPSLLSLIPSMYPLEICPGRLFL